MYHGSAQPFLTWQRRDSQKPSSHILLCSPYSFNTTNKISPARELKLKGQLFEEKEIDFAFTIYTFQIIIRTSTAPSELPYSQTLLQLCYNSHIMLSSQLANFVFFNSNTSALFFLASLLTNHSFSILPNFPYIPTKNNHCQPIRNPCCSRHSYGRLVSHVLNILFLDKPNSLLIFLISKSPISLIDSSLSWKLIPSC